MKWVGAFNWRGELHSLDTIATSKEKAFGNMVCQLSRKLGVGFTVVWREFKDSNKCDVRRWV